MYKNSPQHKNTAAKICALSCLLSGGALFCLTNARLIAFASLAQLIGILLIAAAVYIASAFLLRSYTYIVEENGSGGYDFLITEKKNKRDIKVLHFYITDISSAREVNPSNHKQIQAERKAKKRYTYCTEFGARRFVEINAAIDGELYSVFVPYDRTLLDLLNSLII